MANLFGSIPKPEVVMHEVTYEWLPMWAYNYKEVEDIKMSSVRFTHDTYTLLEPLVQTTTFFDK